jgi:glycosyltransferase involved in cell wall biosynthesis
MKILYISPWFPYPPINGAKIRIYNLIRQLSKHHEITLLAFPQTIPLEEARSSIPKLSQYCQSIKVLPFKSFTPQSKSTYRGFLSLKPRSIVHTQSPQIANMIEETVKSDFYDLILVSEVSAPSVASFYASKIKGIPKILDALEIALYRDAYHNQTHLIKRIRNGLTWFKYRRFTQKVLQQSDSCTVPSKQEKNNLEKLVPANYPIEIIPHCLDIAHYQDSYGPIEQSLVFTGSFSYHANFDAVRFLLEEIYPNVQKQNPDIKMKIIGSTKQTQLNQLPLDNSIIFTGLLEDVRPEIARSWLSVVPLRVGAGTRLKIIESMALGTPVISTSKGAEGLNVDPGENILIADDPQEFSQAILKVLESPTLREKLSLAGLRLVTEQYSSEFMGRKFEDLFNRMPSISGAVS